eukprot:bmy_06773T0
MTVWPRRTKDACLRRNFLHDCRFWCVYIKLQNVYSAKAKKDASSANGYVDKVLQSIGQAMEAVSQKELKFFCSNSSFLGVDGIISSMNIPDNEIVLYLMLWAVDGFHKGHSRHPGEYRLSVMVKDDYVHKLCCYGTAEPHMITAAQQVTTVTTEHCHF